MAQTPPLTPPPWRARRPGRGNGEKQRRVRLSRPMAHPDSTSTVLAEREPKRITARPAADDRDKTASQGLYSLSLTNHPKPCVASLNRVGSCWRPTATGEGLREATEPWWSHLWSHPSTFVEVHGHSAQCGDAGDGRERYSANYYPDF